MTEADEERESKAMKSMSGWMITGVAAGFALATAACGGSGSVAGPSELATTGASIQGAAQSSRSGSAAVEGVSSDGGATASVHASGTSLLPQPESCDASLQLSKVAATKISVSIRAAWVSKVGKPTVDCGSPVWGVTPDAKMYRGRFDPNLLTIAGNPGGYMVTAAAAGQSVAIKVAIGE